RRSLASVVHARRPDRFRCDGRTVRLDLCRGGGAVTAASGVSHACHLRDNRARRAEFPSALRFDADLMTSRPVSRAHALRRAFVRQWTRVRDNPRLLPHFAGKAWRVVRWGQIEKLIERNRMRTDWFSDY